MRKISVTQNKTLATHRNIRSLATPPYKPKVVLNAKIPKI